MITQTLQLNLVPKGISPRLYVTQYDYDSRELTFEIYNGSNRFTLTSGTTAKIQGTKPDRHGFSYNAEVDTTNNVITADITQQMTAVDGDVVVEIVLIKNNKRIGTLNFVMVVQPAGLNDDTDTSDSDLPDIIAEATEQMLTAEAYAKGTRNGTAVTSGQTGYHDNSKYYKEQAATQASNASTSATNANTNALKAEGYAVGKQNGTTQTSGTYYHNNAQYYKEQAASSATTASTKAGEASTSANTASQKASAASTSAQTASDKALVAEGYAKGTQNGTPVGSTSPYYHNNAEYFKNLANPTVAANVSFNNSGTDMSSTNVQDGIVENNTSIQNLSNQTNAILDNIKYEGAKNLFPLLISKIKVINTTGAWSKSGEKDVYTIRGVTYTITSDADGFITNIKANGTSESSSPYADLYITLKNTDDAFTMYELIKNNTLTVATHAGGNIHVILDGEYGSSWKKTQDIYGKADVTLDISTSNNVQICIRIPAGRTVTNEDVTPIMAQKSLMDVDDSFSPYAKSNKELTEDVAALESQINADTGRIKNLLQVTDATLNIYCTNDTVPDWSNLTAVSATDIAQGIYDYFKKIGGEASIYYIGLCNMRYLKASDGTQLGSSNNMVHLFSNTITYNAMLADNTKARLAITMRPYGNSTERRIGLWGKYMTVSVHGVASNGAVSNVDTGITHNTISTYKG